MDSVVYCSYCGKQAAHVTGATLYPHRADCAEQWFYHCADCDASVGCHAKSGLPMGTLANSELRALRIRAHKAFDEVWLAFMQDRKMARKPARAITYSWLAGELGLTHRTCHIAMFGIEECNQVIKLCEEYVNR